MSRWMFLMLMTLGAGLPLAQPPPVGSASGGGFFLYREPVEQYWNDWTAFPLLDPAELPASGQVRITITGEGKTASFIGNLSLNCANGRFFWESAGAESTFLTGVDQINARVPAPVLRNAVTLFCQPR